MNTLLEFINRTKGIEYLLALTVIFAFIAFWQVLHYQGKPRGLFLRLLPTLGAILALGSLAVAGIQAAPVKPSPAGKAKILVTSQVLESLYGPAWLNHDLHKQRVKDCKTCHHFSGENVPQCRQCHGAAFNPEDPSKPGLAHVYHLRCIGCHKENRAGPTECMGCHTKASVSPLPPAHPLTGIQNCLTCHGPKGVKGVTRVPADHAGAPESVCQLCHKPQAVQRAVRAIPHEVDNQQECLLCHGEGIAESRKVPADHAGRTNETCLLCHHKQAKRIAHEDKRTNQGQ